MSVHMYVHTYVCVYVCMFVCMYVYTHTHIIFQKNVVGINSVIISAEQNIRNYFGYQIAFEISLSYQIAFKVSKPIWTLKLSYIHSVEAATKESLYVWHKDTFSYFFHKNIPTIFIYNRILFTQD